MFQKLFTVVVLMTAGISAQTACLSQQSLLASSATEWPQPSGALGSYISSFSSAHNGIISGCSEFTSAMPSTLTSPYQAWVTSVDNWSDSLGSTISAAQSTCVGFVVNIVIATPLCPDDIATSDGSSPTTTGTASQVTSSASMSSATTSAQASSGAEPLGQDRAWLKFVLAAVTGVIVPVILFVST